MNGRLVRVSRGELRASAYVVAEVDAETAVALIRSAIGSEGDEITDLGRVSPELLAALALKPGAFKSVDEPIISQWQPNDPRH